MLTSSECVRRHTKGIKKYQQDCQEARDWAKVLLILGVDRKRIAQAMRRSVDWVRNIESNLEDDCG